MLKVTYKVNSLFSLKKYKDSHLLARSYEHPMLSTIRGAILASVIERSGKQKAEDLFYKIKNAQIFIQHPDKFHKTQQKITMLTNNSMTSKDTDKVQTFDDVNALTTVGIREFVNVKYLVFYIDESIPNLFAYLYNIDRIGNSESHVSLVSIEKVREMEHVLVEWDDSKGYDVELFELYDWVTNLDAKGKKDKGTKFENIYIFSDKLKNVNRKRICYVEEVVPCNDVVITRVPIQMVA
ncbi:hypothetical protein SIM22_03245 [Bacillus cereus group sp. BfR-BA-01363]|uniref:hypothetical protein n=1 Tax=Bacillus cereus group sp. BfR-BA-01363 TaxID=3094882 RepID=UPI0029C217FA|nr:hypothetical protein [Bacillus cereus group sp. BfR-BA-01363]MDX5853139.1 hypothetical protein [Bacillus cereus group sp. BfR-BA-01363]